MMFDGLDDHEAEHGEEWVRRIGWRINQAHSRIDQVNGGLFGGSRLATVWDSEADKEASILMLRLRNQFEVDAIDESLYALRLSFGTRLPKPLDPAKQDDLFNPLPQARLSYGR
jgi:hypothetical protein